MDEFLDKYCFLFFSAIEPYSEAILITMILLWAIYYIYSDPMGIYDKREDKDEN